MSKPLNGFCSGILVGLGQNFSSLGGVSGDPGGETLPLRLRLSVSEISTTSQSCYDRALSVNKLLKTGGDATGETLMLLLGRIAAVNLSKEKNAHFSKRQITAHFKVELRAQNRIRSQSPHTTHAALSQHSFTELVLACYKLLQAEA